MPRVMVPLDLIRNVQSRPLTKTGKVATDRISLNNILRGPVSRQSESDYLSKQLCLTPVVTPIEGKGLNKKPTRDGPIQSPALQVR